MNHRPEPLTPAEISQAFANANRIVTEVYAPLRFRVEVRDGRAFFIALTQHGADGLPIALFDFGSGEFSITHRSAVYSLIRFEDRLTPTDLEAVIARARGAS